MEIHRFGVMKSEFRKSKSEVSVHPPQYLRTNWTHPQYCYGGRGPHCRWQMPSRASWVFAGLPNVPIDAGFGLRVSFGIRYLAFGFAQSLVSPKRSIHDGSL